MKRKKSWRMKKRRRRGARLPSTSGRMTTRLIAGKEERALRKRIWLRNLKQVLILTNSYPSQKIALLTKMANPSKRN